MGLTKRAGDRGGHLTIGPDRHFPVGVADTSHGTAQERGGKFTFVQDFEEILPLQSSRLRSISLTRGRLLPVLAQS